MPPASDHRQPLSADWRVSSTTSSPSAETSQTDLKIPVKDKPLLQEYARLTKISRIVTAVVIVLTIAYRNTIQIYVDKIWFSVRDEAWFRSAYFETAYTTVVYGLLIAFYPFLIHYIPYLQKFKVSSEVTYVHQTVLSILKEVFFHSAPLIVADMLIIKRYPDVPYSEIAVRKQDWIVTTRPLPEGPPNFLVLCLHVIGSVVLFDLFFTMVHYTLHRNIFLYKHFHSLHHTHEIVHAHVTNQLSVVERALQIISANYALKTFGSHPITRLVFVPVFLWLLIENHTGYDLPWGPHQIMPKGIMGGPAKHYLHHTQGHGNYQPFFTYLDSWLEKRKKVKH